jgi:peptidoglycan/LPS O-acetylase OafA/YrhL
MFFYLLFSFALLLPVRGGLVALVALFLALVAVNPLIGVDWVQLKFWSDPIILEFLFGVGLAALFRRGIVLSGRAAIVAILAGAIGLFIAPLWPVAGSALRPLTEGVPAALLVAAAASLSGGTPSPIGRLLVLGGDASYALYLSHPFSINLVVLVWQKLHLAAPWWFALSAIAAALLVSVAVHLALERPLTRWLHRRLDARGAEKPPAFETAAAK